MARKLELGICLFELRSGESQEIRPWDLLEAAEWADKTGLDYLALPDRVSRPVPRFDTLTLMAALALRTQRIRMKTHIFVLPLRHPIELARRIVTVDHLSKGRFIFVAGLGGGAGKGTPVYVKEYEDVGIPRSERGSRANEILESLKKLWTEPSADFSGRHFKFERVVFEPKPFQKPHPPIWIGGNSEAALRRVARYGNGWAPSLEGTAITFGSFQNGLKRLRDYMAEYGRPSDPIHVSVCLKVNVNPDVAAARREAEAFWESQRGSIEGAKSFDVKEKYGVYGTAHELIEKLYEVKEMGVNSVILHIHSFNLKTQLGRLESEVLPRI